MCEILIEHLIIQIFVFFILYFIININKNENNKITIKNIVNLYLLSILIIYIPLLTIYVIIINGGHLTI